MKKKLTKDQEEAVKVLLTTDPTLVELAEFLSNITGKEYSKEEATYYRRKLKLNIKMI